MQGTPHATYDKLTFTEKLDHRSTHSSPAWRDGYKVSTDKIITTVVQPYSMNVLTGVLQGHCL